MENNENNEKKTFRYTYSAQEQEEVRAIRNKYTEPEQTGLERLRRLDAGVIRKARGGALIMGIVGALLLGLGMSLVMTDLGAVLGAYQKYAMPCGIVIGLAGILLIVCAYPLYARILRRERARIAPEILRLTDTLIR